MRVSKLTQHHEQILARAARGDSYSAISDWLAKAHGVSASKQAIGKVLAGHRAERADTTKHVVKEAIEKTLPADLKVYAELERDEIAIYRTALRRAKKTPTSQNYMMARDASAIVHRTREAKLKALGVNEPDKLASNLFDLLGQVLEAK